MSKHKKYGGSTAGRTVNCPAWHDLSVNMPSGPPSLAALEGTMMHMMFEESMLDEEYDPQDYIGHTKLIEGTKLTVTDKHIDKVYTALEVQEDLEEFLDLDEIFCEVMMGHEDSEDIGGTADVVGWSQKNNTFVVGDLKTGDGHMVYAKDNSQLLFYAWLAILLHKEQFMFSEDTIIRLYIIQPSDRRDNPLDYWDVSFKQVMDFGEAYKLAVREAESGHSEPCAGEWCAYCPAMATCPAKTGMIALSKRIPADSTELKDLIAAMHIVDDAEEWCRAVRKTAHEQLEQGVLIEGFKLVPKRATRVWNDPEEAAKKFKAARSMKAEDYLDMKLKSPPQIEKVCKSKKIDFKKYGSMISKVSSGTTLVKDSDKRVASIPLEALANMVASIQK